MFLASPDDIRKVLGFDDMPDINAALADCLNSATSQLESLLHTSFARAEHIDLFFVEEPTFPSGATQFRLSNGLVTGEPEVLVGFDTDFMEPLEGMVFDRDRGLATDLKTRYNRQYVQITYTAGFDPLPIDPADPSDPPPPPVSYDLTQVPKWLQDAARLRAMHLLGSNPVMTEANILLSAKTLTQQFGTLVNARLRYHPAALLPM